MKLEYKDEEIKKEDKKEINESNDITLVRDSLEYYDKYYELYKKKFDMISYLKIIKNNNDFIQDEIYLYDTDKKLLFKSRYEFIGLYESEVNLWAWAWSIPYFKKKTTNIIRKILNYGTELEPTNYFLKSELITSRFKINHPIQLDIHSGISAYLAKKPVIYKIKGDLTSHNENNFLYVNNVSVYNNNKISNSNHIYYFMYLLDYEQFLKE